MENPGSKISKGRRRSQSESEDSGGPRKVKRKVLKRKHAAEQCGEPPNELKVKTREEEKEDQFLRGVDQIVGREGGRGRWKKCRGTNRAWRSTGSPTKR